ncbi:hypothetical protein BHYA_0091g00340 [Botrytis hyacinthi]|uniref:Uncharacterized protein n=1 Tax=Botrytis hyacinthi TaxID=278943 RepID=A0A4Z1GQF5_9HELO|nr:hypothetical protein BHYA_0091g00340 [Botrytis hyacinthi]
MSLYAELFTTFPMLDRTREVPGKRFVHDSKDAILEETYREKTKEIRITIGEWKKLHPEVNIPRIEIVCVSADVLSSFKQPPC